MDEKAHKLELAEVANKLTIGPFPDKVGETERIAFIKAELDKLGKSISNFA